MNSLLQMLQWEFLMYPFSNIFWLFIEKNFRIKFLFNWVLNNVIDTLYQVEIFIQKNLYLVFTFLNNQNKFKVQENIE